MGRHHVVLGLLLLAALSCVGWAATRPKDDKGTELRYAVDQRTGERIAGAIVAVVWRAPRYHDSQACGRLESYVTAEDGSFRTPIDPDSGTVVMGIYKKGYERGRSPRVVRRKVEGNVYRWEVVRAQGNADNTRFVIEEVEPTVYTTEASAYSASREWIDVFAQRSTKDRAGRLRELHRMRVDASCIGYTYSTDGAVPFYRAILAEQIELNDSDRDLEETRQWEASALKRRFP